MRKPRSVKEMYQRFSELCIDSVLMNKNGKYLIKNRYWFAVPVYVQRSLGCDWTIADIRRYGSITISNEAMDKRKSWWCSYDKDISKAN